MVWEKMLPGERAPEVIEVINRMDGAAGGLVTPRDFAAAALVDTSDIRTPQQGFRALRGLATMTFNQMARKGFTTLVDQDMRIEKALAGAATVKLEVLPGQEPVPVAVVNADIKQFGRRSWQRLQELGDAAGSGVAFAWHMQQNGTVSMSIRTGGQPSAAAIAAHLRETMGTTGGGHDTAAAVHFPSLFAFARSMPLSSADAAPEGPLPAPRATAPGKEAPAR
jgi:hypothetical protein